MEEETSGPIYVVSIGQPSDRLYRALFFQYEPGKDTPHDIPGRRRNRGDRENPGVSTPADTRDDASNIEFVAIPVPIVEKTCEVLKIGGAEVKLDIMKGHDHWYYELGKKINENAWKFLSQHELPGDPAYKKHNFK